MPRSARPLRPLLAAALAATLLSATWLATDAPARTPAKPTSAARGSGA
jgi:hypothetical protein